MTDEVLYGDLPSVESSESTKKSEREPARGERANLVGIYPQYRASASLLLDALHKGHFEQARLADNKAGRVDDWQILTPGRLDAYQFKWSRFPETITLKGLVSAKKKEEPILKSLADGWINRKSAFGDRKIVIHLATNSIASTSPQAPATGTKGSELEHRHFAAFIESSWARVRAGEAAVPLKGEPWGDTWEEIQTATGLDDTRFREFVQSCELHFPFKTDFTTGLSEREKQAWDSAVSELTEGLLSLPSRSSETSLGKKDLLRLIGFRAHDLPEALHEFKLEDYVNEPLKQTADRLDDLLDQVDRGYVCLRGTPGSGKSSTLTLALRRRRERLIRYYAFIPQGPNQTRGESENFLAHLVSELNRLEVRHEGKAPHKGDRHLLLERFRDQLAKLGREFQETGRKSLILIDGLDHIVREQNPVKSLLEDLPPPAEVPAGVIFVLGTQTTEFLSPRIREALRKDGRTIPMAPLSLLEIERVLKKTGLLENLSRIQQQRIVELTGGHPLALRYLVRQLESCSSSVEIDASLEAQFPFDDDIQQYYRNLWDQIEKFDYDLTRLLSILARLRKAADFEWLSSWADPKSLDQISKRFSHYFEKSSSHLQFFHNSFRIFIVQLTSEDEDGEIIRGANEQFHRQLAKHCAETAEDSPWRAEQFFHLSESGQAIEALSLARSKWFRDQFLAMRPREEIFADIREGFKLAADLNCGLSAARLVLAESELASRFEALDIDRTTMLSLLIQGKEAARALGWIRIGNNLRVTPDAALELVGVLQDVGETDEAEKLFNLIEPSSRLSPASLTSGVRSQRQALLKWAKVAVAFLPFGEVVAVIRRFEFSATSEWDSGNEVTRPIDQQAERARTLANLAIRFEASGESEWCARVAEEFEWNAVPAVFRLEYLLVCLENGSAPIEELMQLQVRADDATRLRLAELLAKKGFVEEVAVIFPELEVPKFSRGAISGHEVEQEQISRAWLRIAFFLGQRIPDEVLDRYSHPALRASAVLAAIHHWIAGLHARAWRGEVPSDAALSAKIGDVFETFNGYHLDPGYGHDIHLEKPRIMRALADACMDLGPGALTTVSAALDRQWTHPVTSRFWNNSLRRDVVVDLCDAGVELNWVRKWLAVIGEQVEDSSSVGSRVSEYVAQAKAWMAADEPMKALGAARAALQKSLGVGYHKDFQLSGWIEYLDRAGRDGYEPSPDLISQIARAVVSLDGEVDGSATAEAAVLLLRNTFRANPAAGIQLWDYFTENKPVSFSRALTTIVQTVLESSERPSVAALIVGELLVPLAHEPDPTFVAGVLSRVFESEGREAAQSYADLYASRVDTYAEQPNRNAWWLGLRQACGLLKLDLPQRLSSDLRSRDSYSSDFTDETAAEVFEAKVAFLELVRKRRAHLRAPRSSTGQRPHIDWEELASAMAPQLSARELKIFMRLFHKEPYFAAKVGRALSKRSVDLGLNQVLWSYGEQLLKHIEDDRDRGFISEREMAPIFSILLTADPRGGNKRLLESLTLRQWLGPSFLPDVREGLLLDRDDRSAFDSELEGHLSMLLDGSEGKVSAPALDFTDQSLPTGSQALVRIVFSLLDHPTRVVRYAARRMFVELGSKSDSLWLDELSIALNRNAVPSSLLKLLSQFPVSQLEPCRAMLREVVAGLVERGDIEARVESQEIALKLGILASDSTSGVKASTLPQIALPRVDIDLLASPLRGIWDIVACMSGVAGIAISNLYYRAEQILEELASRRHEALATTEFKSLGWQLHNSGLDYGFTHPDRVLGYQIAYRLLAEVDSAGLIPTAALKEILRLFSRSEKSLVSVIPVVRPALFSRDGSAYDEKAWSEDWLHASLERPFLNAPFLEDGSIVAAYRHSFRMHTDHVPVEEHIGLLRVGPAADNHELDYESHFEPDEQPAEVAEYYDWQRHENDEELFVLGGQAKDLPSPPWLAIHPDTARRLGWHPDSSALFGWADENGNRMAESRWWADGPPDSTESHGNHFTAAGWICLLSPAGWDALRALANPCFDTQCSRNHSKQ